MFASLRAPFVEFGRFAGALYLFDRVLDRVSRKLGLLAFDMYVQPVTQKLQARFSRLNSESDESGFSVRKVGPEELFSYPIPVPREVAEERFAQGIDCLVATKSDEFVGYIWLCPDRFTDDEIYCTYVMPGFAVFDLDVYIRSDYRLSRAFVYLWASANEYLGEQEIAWTFSRISKFNPASQKSHRALGGQKFGSLYALRLWGVQVVVSTLRPRISIARRNGNPVQLQLASPDSQ